MSHSENILSVKKLSSGYGENKILSDITFDIQRGSVSIIIGQNGCGKSTLLKTLARIISDNSGQIIFAGDMINYNTPWQLSTLGISYFAQGGLILPTLTVAEHIALAMKNQSTQRKTDINNEIYTYFPTLAELKTKRGGNLSGGERQMVSFGVMIAQQTSLWMMDEPTAGLSPALVEDSLAFLQKMKNEHNKTMLIVEHNYDIAFQLADTVMIIKEGNLAGTFSKPEFSNPNFLTDKLYN